MLGEKAQVMKGYAIALGAAIFVSVIVVVACIFFVQYAYNTVWGGDGGGPVELLVITIVVVLLYLILFFCFTKIMSLRKIGSLKGKTGDEKRVLDNFYKKKP